MKRKFGIYGCEHGHIATFIEQMLTLGHECIGLYEPRNKELAASVANRFGIPILAERDRLFQEDVSVIGCAAINSEKIDIIEECDAHGKHIMIDKPGVTNRNGLERLQAVMNQGRIQVGMMLTSRFGGSLPALKGLMERGELGAPVSIGMRKPHKLNRAQRPEWFFSKEQNGGILIDLLIHDFDLLHWLTGEEVAESAGVMSKTILPEYPDFYDVVSLQVMMKNGLTAQLYSDWHTPEKSWTWGDGRIFVTGTEGFAELRLSGDPLVGREPLVLHTTHTKETVRVPLVRPDRNLTEDFLVRIEGHSPAVVTHRDILAASRASIEADESVRIVRRG